MIDVWSTPTEHWYELIKSAQQHSNIQLSEDIEHYVVSRLLTTSSDPELFAGNLALEYLNGQGSVNNLCKLGDKCLVIYGLFPMYHTKRLVQSDYARKIGKSSYQHVSLISPNHYELYHNLYEKFDDLTFVLRFMKHHSIDFLNPGFR